MANYENTRYDFNGSNLQGVQGVNTGLIIPWSSGSIPSGFLECDGSAVSRSTYAALFAVVGTNYGVGDGSTTFNLPDLQDRVCQHKSGNKSQFSTGGANTSASTGNITGAALGNTTLSTGQIPSHAHMNTGAGPTMGFNVFYQRSGGMTDSSATGGGGAHGHSVSSATFTGASDSILQPYLTLVYIIKT